MKNTSLVNCLLAFVLLVACVLGCNKAGIKTVNDGNENKSAPRETEQPMADIAGGYTITGTNQNGTTYNGALEVIKHGSVYEFRWKAGKEYGGVGVQNGNVVAVAFSNGNGKGCGVVSYRLTDDTLDGKWGYWGVDQSGTEIATRTSGTGLSGDYDVIGKNPNGTTYKGTLKISPEGGGYTFVWGNGSTGFGLKQGEMISVGIGGSRCGFMSYQIKANSLDGIWGSSGSEKTGIERAVKK